MRILAALLFVLTSMFGFAVAQTAHAEKRVALVIGNSRYLHVPELANPRNDAADMAGKLEQLGFEVVRGEDLDLDGMRKAARDFTGRLEGAEMALFFYAGHGLQVNGTNYMAPVDARLRDYDDLDYEVMPMDLVLGAMERKTKTNLVFLDACRDNPLAENLARSMGTRSAAVGRGLARIGGGVGTLISLATQPGNIALDGRGRNSPFTGALLKHLGTPGQDITRDLVLVRRDVLDATDGKQVPWDHSSLTGDVVLTEMPAKPETAAEPTASGNTAEVAYWESIKSSSDRAYFEAYLKQFPEGVFAGLARLEIAKLTKKAEVQAEKDRQAKAESERQRRAESEAEADRLAKELEKAEAERKAARQASGQVQVASLAPESEPEPAELIRSVQTELNRVGCSVGRVDGKWGSGSAGALREFASRQGIKLASTNPGAEILERLKATDVRVCPLVCGRGLEEKNGRCVATERKASVETKPASRTPSSQPTVTPEASGAARKKFAVAKDCYVCTYMGKTAKACVDKGMPITNSNFPITTGGNTPGPGACKKL